MPYLARERCAMNLIEIARRLDRDASTVSQRSGSYETVRDLKREKNIAAVIAKSIQA
jgi:chromosomal replication initiation ATPase DnaA